MIKGKTNGMNLRIEKIQAGKSQFRDLPIQEPMILAPLIRPYAVMMGLPKGKAEVKKVEAYLMEPSALALIPLSLSLSRSESAGQSYKLDARYLNQTLTSKIRGDGSLIEEVTDIAGMPVIAKPISKDLFAKLNLVSTKLDLVQQARVDYPELKDARERKSLSLRLSGISTQDFQLNRHRQTLSGDVLTVKKEKLPAKSAPVQSLVGRGDLKKYLDSEVSIPVFEPQIQRKAQEIVKKENDLWKRAMLIHDFVYRHLEKRAFVSLPDALEALQTKQGDCNEHSALYTALARAAGVPTRTVVGLVYSDIYQANPQPGFYYHAWVEVYTGHQWVAIDPTWNQVPADATHIAFVEGGADQQIQIASLMGKIRFSPVVEAKVKEAPRRN